MWASCQSRKELSCIMFRYNFEGFNLLNQIVGKLINILCIEEKLITMFAACGISVLDTPPGHS